MIWPSVRAPSRVEFGRSRGSERGRFSFPNL
jgi:hypothetical protein